MKKISPTLLLPLGLGIFSPLLQSITQVPAVKIAFGILGVALILIAFYSGGTITNKAEARETIVRIHTRRFQGLLPSAMFTGKTLAIAASILVLFLNVLEFDSVSNISP